MKKVMLFVFILGLPVAAWATGSQKTISDPYIPEIYVVWRTDVPGYEGQWEPVSGNLINDPKDGYLPHNVTITDLPNGLKSYSVGTAWEGAN